LDKAPNALPNQYTDPNQVDQPAQEQAEQGHQAHPHPQPVPVQYNNFMQVVLGKLDNLDIRFSHMEERQIRMEESY
jgi:hypothetical protein